MTDADQNSITFDADLLSKCSPALQRNLVKHAMQTLRPAVDVNYSTLERAVAAIKNPAHSSRVDLKGGLRMFRESNHWYICTLDAELPFNLWPQLTGQMSVPLSVPGQVELAGGWKFNCESWGMPVLAREQAERNEDPFQVWLDVKDLSKPLQTADTPSWRSICPVWLGWSFTETFRFFGEREDAAARAGELALVVRRG